MSRSVPLPLTPDNYLLVFIPKNHFSPEISPLNGRESAMLLARYNNKYRIFGETEMVTESNEQLLTAKDIARRLSLSKRQIFRLNNCAKIPAPLRISGSVRWRLSDIAKWIELGCPSRKDFEARRETQR
jgi:predicted DNA-binding transcriptional regulator AlpA